LEDDEWKKWSDYIIAEKCNVSHVFVGTIRKESYPESINVNRLAKNKKGTVSSINTTNIGRSKKPKQKEIEEEEIEDEEDNSGQNVEEEIVNDEEEIDNENVEKSTKKEPKQREPIINRKKKAAYDMTQEFLESINNSKEQKREIKAFIEWLTHFQERSDL